MNTVSTSLILTSIIWVADILTGGKKSLTKYLLYFLVVLGVSYSFKAHSEAIDIDDNPILTCRYMDSYDDSIDPNDDVWIRWMMHGKHGRKLYFMASDIVWYMPQTEDTELAKSAFLTAMAGIVPQSICTRLLAMTLTYLTQYGLDSMDKYKTVNNYLSRSQYHFEMYDFYEKVMEMDQVKAYIVNHVHVDEEDLD